MTEPHGESRTALNPQRDKTVAREQSTQADKERKNRLSSPLRGAKCSIFTIWFIVAIIGALGVNEDFRAYLAGDTEELSRGMLSAFFSPELAFGLGVGWITLILFFALLSRVDTVRVPIACSITIVFFAILLLPEEFTHALPEAFVGTLSWAFSLIIGFYFGSEAAVQATEIVQRRKLASASNANNELARESISAPGDSFAI